MIHTMTQAFKLTKNEELLRDYIHLHPECIFQFNAKELSQLTHISSPTIVRFTQKIGFNGFNDFKIAYIQTYNSVKTEESYNLNQNSSIHDILNTLPNIYNEVIQKTNQANNHEVFVRVLNYMSSASSIDFYANDNNYSHALSISLRLNTLGIHSQAFNTINTAYVDSLDSKNHLAFVVSFTGTNEVMLKIAYELRKKRIRVIGITSSLNPSLSLICNESLLMNSSYNELGTFSTYHALSLYYILDILYTSLLLKKSAK